MLEWLAALTCTQQLCLVPCLWPQSPACADLLLVSHVVCQTHRRTKRLAYLAKVSSDVGLLVRKAAGYEDRLQRALLSLCSHKVAAWQQQAEALVTEYSHIRWLQGRLGDTSRMEHKKLQKELLKSSAQLKAAVDAVVSWEQQRRHYHHLVGGSAVGGAQQGLAGTSNMEWHNTPVAQLVQQLQQGTIPWCADAAATPATLHPKLARIKQPLRSLGFELRAARQERDLLQQEVEACQVGMQLEVAVLEAAVAQQQQQHVQLQDRCHQLAGATAWDSMCALANAQHAAREAGGRALLLEQRLVDARMRLHKAQQLFARNERSISSNAQLADVVVQAAAACAERSRGVADDSSEDEGDLSDDSDDSDAGLFGDMAGGNSAAAADVDAADATDAGGPAGADVAAAGASSSSAASDTSPWQGAMAPWAASDRMMKQYDSWRRYNLRMHLPPEVQGALSCGLLRIQAGRDAGYPLFYCDLETLLPDKWVMDSIINIYMRYLQLRDLAVQEGRGSQWWGLEQPNSIGNISCHFFSTHFMEALRPQHGVVNYNSVARWTRRDALRQAGQAKHDHALGVLGCSLVVAPVHLGVEGHWVLVVADLTNCCVMYIDPLRATQVS